MNGTIGFNPRVEWPDLLGAVYVSYGLFSGWQIRLDNPTFLGWLIVAAYFLAALACARAAKGAPGTDDAKIWWILTAGMAFLGVNKQLNLQTLLIVMGRNLAAMEGWSDYRRHLQLIFSVIFGLVMLGALAWFARRSRGVFGRNRTALPGAIVLVLFIVLRAATINHADQFLRINMKDAQWAWILELTGSTLIGIAALKQAARHE